MGQARPTQYQVTGLKRADPVTDERLTRGLGNEVQLVFIVKVPTRKLRGKPMA